MVCSFFSPCCTVVYNTHNSVITRKVVKVRLNGHLVEDETKQVVLGVHFATYLLVEAFEYEFVDNRLPFL